MHTTKQVIQRLSRTRMEALPAPVYIPKEGPKVMMAVKAMEHHMTDEGWQIAQALEHAGYTLCGHGLKGSSDVNAVLARHEPSVVVVQDKREWEGLTADGSKNPQWRFANVESLAHPYYCTFNLTVLKDAHRDPEYNQEAGKEIGCHAWIVYYHPDIVAHVAPYARKEHLIRTYHTLDSLLVPPFQSNRLPKAIISGAVSRFYPLRMRIVQSIQGGELGGIQYLRHPGYHRSGCETPEYLKTLSRFRVSICTSSIFGYALRKVIESVACGCTVITDLPEDDKLPHIDEVLVRVPPDISVRDLAEVANRELHGYSPNRAYYYAQLAKAYYDYRTMGMKLASDIEKLRGSYGVDSATVQAGQPV